MGFVGDLMNGEFGIQWYYIVGLLIFIALFIVIMFRTFRLTKRDINTFKESIFDSEDLANENLN